jgi:hypothetical protein
MVGNGSIFRHLYTCRIYRKYDRFPSHLDGLLDGDGRHILAAPGNNDLLAAAPHHEEPVLVEATQVAGMDPAFVVYQLLCR